MRGKLAVGLSAVLLILLPVSGLVGGGYVAFEWARPPADAGGLSVFPHLMVTAFGAAVGLAVGVGAAWMIALGLFRWANGCGLGDIRDDTLPWWGA